MMFEYQYDRVTVSTQAGVDRKERESQELAEAVAEFVRNGGKIQQISGFADAKKKRPVRKHIRFGKKCK